jgi:hypothetical protein
LLPLMLRSVLNMLKRKPGIEKNKQSRKLKERKIEENFKRRNVRQPDLPKRRLVLLKKTKEMLERVKELPRELLKPPESLPRLKDKSKLLCKRKRMPMTLSKSLRKREEQKPSPRRRPPNFPLKKREKLEKRLLKKKPKKLQRKPLN